MIDTHLIWAPAAVTVAYFGRNVAVTWLNHRAEANARADARAERESDVAAMREELKKMRTDMNTFIANQRGR